MSEVKMEKVSIRRIMEIIHDPQNMLEHGRRDYWYNQIHLILEKAFADQRTALLTKLRDEVMGMQHWEFDYEQAHPMNTESNITTLALGSYVNYAEVLALLEKEGGEG